MIPGMPLTPIELRASPQPQKTLRTAVHRSGLGLHSGTCNDVRLWPAPENTGIVFRVGRCTQRLRPETVSGTDRCTAVNVGEATVLTVEHLLAALQGMAVDNVLVEVEGTEIPALDGSAKGWAEAIAEAGLCDQCEAAQVFYPVTTTEWSDVGSRLTAHPCDRLEITCTIAYEHPLIGVMTGTYVVNPETFCQDLAPARTYGFIGEVEELRKRGLIRGGSLANAIVVYEDHYSSDLLFPDELVRHKVLDLLGDLYVLGWRFCGVIEAFRPGHRVNHAFVRSLVDPRTATTLSQSIARRY